jgi:hypothetical protein
VSDPFYSSVALLLHGDGSNGSTTFVDSGPDARTVAVSGSAVISTADSKFGGASIHFPGSDPDSGLEVAGNADFDFGTGDFCLELWVKGNVTNQNQSPLAAANFSESTGPWWLVTCTPSGPGIQFSHTVGGSTSTLSAPSTNVHNNAWNHIAVTRDGSTLRLFVNGALITSGSAAGAIGRADTAVSLGFSGNFGPSFFGYIDDVRITKGQARYTAAFTPHTVAHPDTDVSSDPASAIIQAAGPLGVPALRLQHQFASIAASGPLGTAQILGAQQIASIEAAGPLGRAQILATFPVVATVTASGPLGQLAALLWHDFTASLTGQEISRYVMDLITPGGVVRVPISSWQATLQTDASSFVQCVVPGASEYVDQIVAATEFVITRMATLPSGQSISYEMARSPVEQIVPSQGPTNYTVVLSGYPEALTANEDPPAVQDRTLSGVRSVAGLPGSVRVRCSIDWLLRPGMRAFQAETPILVDYINYYVNTSDQYMDVGERS